MAGKGESVHEGAGDQLQTPRQAGYGRKGCDVCRFYTFGGEPGRHRDGQQTNRHALGEVEERKGRESGMVWSGSGTKLLPVIVVVLIVPGKLTGFARVQNQRR